MWKEWIRKHNQSSITYLYVYMDIYIYIAYMLGLFDCENTSRPECWMSREGIRIFLWHRLRRVLSSDGLILDPFSPFRFFLFLRSNNIPLLSEKKRIHYHKAYTAIDKADLDSKTLKLANICCFALSSEIRLYRYDTWEIRTLERNIKQ